MKGFVAGLSPPVVCRLPSSQLAFCAAAVLTLSLGVLQTYGMVAGQFLRWQRVVDGLNPISLATNKFLERAFLKSRFSTTGPFDQSSDPLIFSFTINSKSSLLPWKQ